MIFILFLIQLLVLVIIVEATTEIVIKSLLFESIRNNVYKIPIIGKFIHKILSCGHCFSVWCSFLVVFIYYKFFLAPKNFSYKVLVMYFFVSILVHRLSNYLHMFIDRYIDKFYQKKE